MGDFEERAKSIANTLKERDNFAIVYHYDADGICAGAIIAKSLESLGKKFKSIAVKQLYAETIEEIKGLGKNYIFADFGSAMLEELRIAFKEDFFVFDHHQPKTPKYEYEFHLNPFEFGINGGDDISGAGVCYEVAKALCEDKSLSALAVVGALGDMQDFSGSLKGKNREILQESVDSGFIEVKKDLRLYGRISRPLTQFLCFSSNPVLPGLTADEKACAAFLTKNGIEIKSDEKWISYDDLDIAGKKKLTTALLMHLQKYNFPEWKLQELVGDVYILKKERAKSPLKDGKEFATMLNACGRHGEAEIGLKICMGDRKDSYSKALSLLAEHRKQLREGIELMHEKGVDEMESFYFFDAGNEIKDSIVGIVAGMLYGSGALQSVKPIVAFGRHSDGSIKVSARGTSDLLKRGLNLGKALRETCAELGEESQGGGHKIAAGAKILADKKEKFLEIFNEKIKGQLA